MTEPGGSATRYAAIDLAGKFARFSEHWSPRIVARMNDYHFKLVKIQGEFVWHSHAETDEVFIVLDGAMTIHFRDGALALRAGEMFVVPKGVEHKPSAEMLSLPGMDEHTAYILASRGVITRDDLAELAVDEIIDIEGMDAETAAKLIMAARQHWFDNGYNKALRTDLDKGAFPPWP